MLGGRIMETRDEHPENALPPIEVTLSGITISVNEEQPLKAF